MLNVTIADLRKLLDSPAEQPVLYVMRDEESGKPDRLDVWAEAYVSEDDIVVGREELVDALDGADEPHKVDDDALKDLLEEYQEVVDEILGSEEIPDNACADADGNVHPEHDFLSREEGYECRRCGAEADSEEPDGVYRPHRLLHRNGGGRSGGNVRRAE